MLSLKIFRNQIEKRMRLTSLSGSSQTSAVQNKVPLDPETLSSIHLSREAIELLKNTLGYNMKNWTIKEGDFRHNYKKLDEGIHLGYRENDGELDIIIVTAGKTHHNWKVIVDFFVYKNGIPTTHFKHGSPTDAEKIEQGYEALHEAVQRFYKHLG